MEPGAAVAPGTWETLRADFLLGPQEGWTEDAPSLPSRTQSCAIVGSSQRLQETRTGAGWVPGSVAALLGPKGLNAALLADASDSLLCAFHPSLSLCFILVSFS